MFTQHFFSRMITKQSTKNIFSCTNNEIFHNRGKYAFSTLSPFRHRGKLSRRLVTAGYTNKNNFVNILIIRQGCI